MFALFDIPLYLYFIYFLFAIFLAWYIPGDIVLSKLSLSNFQRSVLALLTGIVLWGWQGYVFGYLHLRWFPYIYLLFFLLFWLKKLSQKEIGEIKKVRFFEKRDLILLLLLFTGTLMQLSAAWFNGVIYKNGIYFCCGNPEDNFFHISLTNALINHIPPFEPGAYGVVVQNYHYWGNLILAELIRVFHLPLVATEFQYFTILTSLLLGLSAVVFGQLVNMGKIGSRWLIFFLYFGGDLIYLLLSIRGKGINFQMSSIEDGSKFLSNPPRAISIVLFFAAISIFVIWIRKKDRYSGFITMFLLGSLIGFKVYTGIFVLTGLGVLGIYYLFKKQYTRIAFILFAFFLSIMIYLPVNSGAGGLYFTYFWIFENFASQPLLGFTRLMLAHAIYISHHNIPKIAIDEIFFITLFTFGIFGTKLFGFVQSFKSLRVFPKELHIFFLSGILVSAVTGFFFQQTSGGSNTFNFLVSIFIFSSLYAALACTYLLDKIRNKVILNIAILLIIILTIPRVIYETRNNLANLFSGFGYYITGNEIEAFSYLTSVSSPNAIVLVNSKAFEMDEHSSYINFLIPRRMFLSGIGLLDSHKINVKDQKKDLDIILNSKNASLIGETLNKDNIDYIIFTDVFPRV